MIPWFWDLSLWRVQHSATFTEDRAWTGSFVDSDCQGALQALTCQNIQNKFLLATAWMPTSMEVTITSTKPVVDVQIPSKHIPMSTSMWFKWSSIYSSFISSLKKAIQTENNAQLRHGSLLITICIWYSFKDFEYQVIRTGNAIKKLVRDRRVFYNVLIIQNMNMTRKAIPGKDVQHHQLGVESHYLYLL